jgi:hypothetical protein
VFGSWVGLQLNLVLEPRRFRPRFHLYALALSTHNTLFKFGAQRWPGDIVVAVFGRPLAAKVVLPLPCRQPSAEAVAARVRAVHGDLPVPADAAEAEEAAALALPLDAWRRLPKAGAAVTPKPAAALLSAEAPGSAEERRRLEGALRDYRRKSSKASKKESNSKKSRGEMNSSSTGNLFLDTFAEIEARARDQLRNFKRPPGPARDAEVSGEGGPTGAPLTERRVVAFGVPSEGEHGAFPVNALRNAALCHVATSHALYTDVDLWPSETL